MILRGLVKIAAFLFILQALLMRRGTPVFWTQVVLTGPLKAFGLDFDEFFGLGVALRAFCRRVLSLIDIATYEASEFLFHDWIQLLVLVQDTKLFQKSIDSIISSS